VAQNLGAASRDADHSAEEEEGSPDLPAA
jgi:hypothetical protein